MESYSLCFLTGNPVADELSLELDAAEASYAAAQCDLQESADDAAAYVRAINRYNVTGDPADHPDADVAAFGWIEDVPTIPLHADDDDRTPPPAAPSLAAQVAAYTDDALVIAIDLASHRDRCMNLHAVGNQPDRHDEFVEAATAEILRRLADKIAGTVTSRLAA